MWTFQFDLNEVMVWKGGKSCGAVFTVRFEWNVHEESKRDKIFFRIISPLTISAKVVYILENCCKGWKLTVRSKIIAELHIISLVQVNWSKVLVYWRGVYGDIAGVIVELQN